MVFGHVDAKMTNSQNHTMDDLTRTPVASGGGCVKVFIQRDYSEGTNVKFLTKFPPELEGRIDKVAFEHTVSTMNSFYAEAEKATSRAYCESCLACITAYIVYVCMESHYEKCLKRLGRFVHEQNVNVYEPKGLLIVDPIERGLRVIEIVILNEPAAIRS